MHVELEFIFSHATLVHESRYHTTSYLEPIFLRTFRTERSLAHRALTLGVPGLVTLGTRLILTHIDMLLNRISYGLTRLLVNPRICATEPVLFLCVSSFEDRSRSKCAEKNLRLTYVFAPVFSICFFLCFLQYESPHKTHCRMVPRFLDNVLQSTHVNSRCMRF